MAVISGSSRAHLTEIQKFSNTNVEKSIQNVYTNAFYALNKNRQENIHFSEVLWATLLFEHEEKLVITQKKASYFIFLVPSKLIQYLLNS